MIRYLEGTVISKEERSFVLLVQGVGYQILTSAELLSTEEGAQISVYIHTHVREDEISLYGFSSPKELKFFELLLTVNGVGPKMALETL
ncbi:MAG: Holliday junction branch migration protein RuvA, partial [Patescibacteria group bacterium]